MAVLVCGNCGYWHMDEVKVRERASGRCNCISSPKYLNQTGHQDTCDKWGPEGGRGPRAVTSPPEPKKPFGVSR